MGNCDVRNGLISLLAVGDNIYHVGLALTKNKVVNGVRTDKVISIDGKTIQIASDYREYTQNVDLIDEYNGKLYVWSSQGYEVLDREDRIQKLIKILSSNNTIYSNSDGIYSPE